MGARVTLITALGSVSKYSEIVEYFLKQAMPLHTLYNILVSPCTTLFKIIITHTYPLELHIVSFSKLK